MKEKVQFKPGDKIFAKVKGFVYWPARVNPLPEDVIIPPNKIPIFFYGTHEVYFISSSSCWPYDEKNKSKWGKPHTRAHFNEGMDEIENNPTLFQYGVDPTAEEYLAQFYDFKRSDGDKPITLKKDVNKRSQVKKDVDKTESTINPKEKNHVKENLEDSKDLAKKEEIKDKEENIDETVSSPSVPSDNSKDMNYMPKSRSKSFSSSKKAAGVKLSIPDEKSDGSDSEDVSIDNPKDEDFRPAKKKSRVSRNVSVRKSENKKIVKPKAAPRTKSAPKAVKKASNSKKGKEIGSDNDDSLSSISSIEDWQERDEKKRKEHEDMLKTKQMEELLKDELAIKEASRQARKKSHSKSSGHDCIKEEATEDVKVEGINKEEAMEFKGNAESYLDGTENIDMKEGNDTEEVVTGDTEKEVVSKKSDKSHIKKVIPKKVKKERLSTNKQKTTNNRKRKMIDSEESEEELQKTEVQLAVDKSEPLISETENGVEEDVRKNMDEENISADSDKEVLLKKKPVKRARATTKPLRESRKIKLLDSDDSEEEEDKRGSKKIKLMRPMSHDSDNEVTKEDSALIIKPPIDPIKALHAFNSDIKSSLLLGHEDYDKCLSRFRSLCTMQLDLMSLVSVWQLMDTVKKCRRYKRHEPIKNEAQLVYKRFMEIYTHSSVDDVKKAQEILAQTRCNTSKNENNMNGHFQNPSVPQSVDDMFQHGKQHAGQAVNNKTSPVAQDTLAQIEEKEGVSKDEIGGTKDEEGGISKDEQKNVGEEEERVPNNEEKVMSIEEEKIIKDEEKMRLLSVDLEAKVSDILNKIEKNSKMNPINRQSLSHLLPPRSGESVIPLPAQWESVDNSNREHSKDNNKINDVSDDEDEEDEEVIAKRIDNIAIKHVEITEETDTSTTGNGDSNVDNSASALDTRIESLFNTTLGTGGKESVGAKPRKVARTKRHSATSHKTTKIRDTPTSTTVNNNTTTTTTITAVSEPTTADTVIYDLLGV